MPAVGCCVSPTNLAAGFLFEEVLSVATAATFHVGQGGERQRPDFAPLEHSRGLGTQVLVTTPSDRLGPLFVVTQVPLHHVVVPAAPTAIFSELDSCKDRAAVGQLEAFCSRPPALFLSSGGLSRESISSLPQY